MPRAQAVTAWLLIACAQSWACGGGAANSKGPLSGSAWQGVDGSRFTWIESDCSDGPVDLARLGFERELELQVREGALLIIADTELIAEGCSTTSLVLAKPASDPALWQLEPQAIVSLPPERECGAAERDATQGSLRMSQDLLEIVVRRSGYCRGYDARFVYRRAPQRRLTPRELIGRYVAHWNRGDADALADLYVDSGSLVEPFTRTEDGNYKRHEGRAALRAYYAGALASAPWSALRLLALDPGREEGQFTAEWEYMDPHLSEPLRGRNLFVIAGGEIYEAELQLLSDPKPAANANQTAAASAPSRPPVREAAP